MEETIRNFFEQFRFEPKITGSENFVRKDKYIVVGMGGSHLAAGILKTLRPGIDIKIHRNYGLPEMTDEELGERLLILSSYSGNTAEPIDAFKEGLKRDVSMAVISVGGELLELAKSNNVPYVALPDTGIQPRMALGYSLKTLLKIVGDDELLNQASALADKMKANDFEMKGSELADRLSGFIPVIYASARNLEIAYIWKIKFNETGKIPAFCNRFPELNHNEMTGFDVNDFTRTLSEKFYFLILRDDADDPRIQKRMDVLQQLYENRGLKIERIEVAGDGELEKIFSSLVLADWAAYYTARNYGNEPEAVPMVEEFKDIIKG